MPKLYLWTEMNAFFDFPQTLESHEKGRGYNNITESNYSQIKDLDVIHLRKCQ